MRLATLIEQFEPALLAHAGERLLPSARRALAARRGCRDPDGPCLLARCADCQSQRSIPPSCGHRSCPHCQHHESATWLERQCQRRLPVDYFMVTFTLPHELRPLAWGHQRRVYDALFGCAWQCLARFALNDSALAVEVGATAVLHTHNRRRDYHPHVHLVVPAGGVDRKHRLWRRKDGYLFNAFNLARVFRAKLLAALREAGLALTDRLPQRWVVDCRQVGRGEQALGYLARYLYRGVLSASDILGCRDGQVSFRYTESKTGRTQIRTLPGADFLWLLLQHVLPRGFRRAREYGLLHPRRKGLLQRVQLLLDVKLNPVPPTKRPAISCPHCGAPMRIIATGLPARRAGALRPRLLPARTLPM